MAVRVALHHRSEYRYDRPVALGPQVIRLRPAAHCRTRIESYSLRVEPAGHFLNWQQDPVGNHLARAVLPRPTDRLTVEVDLVAELVAVNPFDFFLDAEVETWGFRYADDLAGQLAPFLAAPPPGPRLRAWLDGCRLDGLRTIDALVALNRRACAEVRYLVRHEPGVQTPEETLEKGSGSCRDSAWLLVQALRGLGVAARFASGYLIQLVPDQPVAGRDTVERDFTDLHAWCEAFLPGAGWVGLDATSGLLCGEGHLPLACAAEPAAAAPITGGFAFDPAQGDRVSSELAVTMTVTRLDERARPTAPFSAAQWSAIDRLGRAIDRDLRERDVRLTAGGEPTFLAGDDSEAPEWTTAALGAGKRRLAGALLLRMRDRFAPGAFLHHGQGKWYPGEVLPRWALSAWWRADGEPLWRDAGLWADESRPPGHGSGDARCLALALCRRLGLPSDHLAPGFEDAWYWLWRERRLPVDADPRQLGLADPEQRARLARLFDGGLAEPVGWVLPLARRSGAWVTGPWRLRSGRIDLIPGDSPMGFRLPLDALPPAPADGGDDAVERDPLQPRAPLPPRAALPGPDLPPAPVDPGRGPLRNALCVEPRGGVLRVFMPPLASAEDYLALVAALEDAAAACALPLLCEGYQPPRDHRLRSLAVTPDPGVIEVNVHPAADWEELAGIVTGTYAEAAALGLRAERFDLDGRHTGTGGGNHITLGGPTAADSPFLRRPALLRSLLAYLHNHPALSYVFAGSCVGATSQAPRPDEARPEAAYELARALELLDRAEGQGGSGGAAPRSDSTQAGRDEDGREFRLDRPASTPPWLVDRVLRHLLVDVTGNTHRTQLSIDKLFAPETAAGRLGLVELRAGEMPPEPRMALLQHALLRGLVAWFWDRPYRRGLCQWGTRLHDEWMLPWNLREDLDEVLADLRGAGYPFAPEWFDAQFAFRFPVIGAIVARGVRVELRSALEPWPVLGEEPGGGGTVRYVDSSMERVQVLAEGFDPQRWALAVNGWEIPLRPTGTAGVHLAGVRYRAWQPPSCLHPTVPVDAPLVFDLYDRWAGRAIAGCTYHVVHPGGRAHDRLPVNALEAESRRAARFRRDGHRAGPYELRGPRASRDYPGTLDLRWQDAPAADAGPGRRAHAAGATSG